MKGIYKENNILINNLIDKCYNYEINIENQKNFTNQKDIINSKLISDINTYKIKNNLLKKEIQNLNDNIYNIKNNYKRDINYIIESNKIDKNKNIELEKLFKENLLKNNNNDLNNTLEGNLIEIKMHEKNKIIENLSLLNKELKINYDNILSEVTFLLFN